MHLACVGAEAVEIVCATQLPTRRPVVVVVEIKIREMRKVGVRHGKGSVITGIVFRERNICVSAQRAGKDVPANIEELQSIVGEKQLGRDVVEGQRFSQKDVVHSICAIHLDLQ